MRKVEGTDKTDDFLLYKAASNMFKEGVGIEEVLMGTGIELQSNLYLAQSLGRDDF